MADHVVAVLRGYIAEHFTKGDGELWSQRAIAKAMGLPQPVLNAILQKKGLGINALIDLRNAMPNTTIDSLLGLEPVAAPSLIERRVQAQIDELRAEISRPVAQKMGPHSKAGKAFAEVERVRQVAVGNQRLAEKKQKEKDQGKPPRRRAESA